MFTQGNLRNLGDPSCSLQEDGFGVPSTEQHQAANVPAFTFAMRQEKSAV